MTAGNASPGPPDVAAKIAALGPIFSPDVLALTARLYEPLVAARPVGGIQVHANIAYGPHERHRLDVFRPDAQAGRPVLVFIHGGGFISGDKSISERFYRNIGHWFAERGIVCITANYRLAPVFKWPAGPDDVGLVVEWIGQHIGSFGGDAGKTFLFGHSAGACHVASYLFASDRQASGVLGAALVSGIYRDDDNQPQMALYFGEDAEARKANSPLSRASRNEHPILVALAEFDPGWTAGHSLELALALTTSEGRCPPLAWLGGHNHVSTVFSLGSSQTETGDAILAFIRGVLGESHGIDGDWPR